VQRTFATAYDQICASFPTRATAIAWFRDHHDTIVALLRTVVEQEWGNDLGWSLAEAVWTLLHHDGHFDAVVQTQRLGAQDAARRGHVFAAVALCRQAHALRHLHRYDEAHACCTRALDLVEQHRGTWSHEDREWVCSVALHGRGRVAEARGDLGAALSDFLASWRAELAMVRRRPEATGYGVALRCRDIAWAKARQRDFLAAWLWLGDAEQIFRRVADQRGDPTQYGRTLYTRARVCALAGDHNAARMAYQAADIHLTSVEGHRLHIELDDHAARSDIAVGELTVARERLSRARDRAHLIGDAELATAFTRRIQELTA
jgi:tetratricopeptide (TPR) repeat protein